MTYLIESTYFAYPTFADFIQLDAEHIRGRESGTKKKLAKKKENKALFSVPIVLQGRWR